MDWKEWGKPYTIEERERLMDAAKENDTEGRDSVLMAAALYMGLLPGMSYGMLYVNALSDAVSVRLSDGNCLILETSPNFKREVIRRLEREQENNGGALHIGCERITDYTEKQAKEAILKAFQKAGMTSENSIKRFRRTAAVLHYREGWNHNKLYLREWFKEGKTVDEDGVYYYDDDFFMDMREHIDALETWF